jgi:hypothetical protein
MTSAPMPSGAQKCSGAVRRKLGAALSLRCCITRRGFPVYLHDSINGRSTEVERRYDTAFKVTPLYFRTLPGVLRSTRSPAGPVPIQQVGVSNLRLPLKFQTPSRRRLVLSVTGTVSLTARLRDIHKGRIVRLFYDYQHRTFGSGQVRHYALRTSTLIASKPSVFCKGVQNGFE